MRELALSQEIAERGRELESAELLWLTAGNIGARAGPANVITPSGIRDAAVEAAHLVRCNLEDGEVLDGARRTSSELRLHRAIYRARPDAGAIVHAHSACRVEDRYGTYGQSLAEPAA